MKQSEFILSNSEKPVTRLIGYLGKIKGHRLRGNSDEMFEKYDLAKGIFIGWLTFFGKAAVEKYNREKILTAPAYRIKELPNEGIFLQASSLPGLYGMSKKTISQNKAD